jgi:thiosulfate/3-mercaptopyruvate sulfurtransferase
MCILTPLRTATQEFDNVESTSMNLNLPVGKRPLILVMTLAAWVSLALAYQASLIPSARLINPDELVKVLQSSKGEKPLMIQVGSHVLFSQAHIPGSEYIGPASTESGIQQLRERVESLPRNKSILIYCGCCPWRHCPNVKPADDALRALGFTNVKVLYIANNFGTDWVDKGYPVAKGD